MFEGMFNHNRRPFLSVPQVERYFPANAIENARTTLARCIQRGEGAGLVVGPSGTGKSLLCLLLAEQFRTYFQVAMLSSGRLSSRRALFQAILYELGRPYRDMDEGDLRLALVDYLDGGDGNPNGLVLLVDEAHTLPLRLLDEIRLLSNLARGGQPLVRLVLAGAPALEERFASPKLDSFSQRLGARCYLEPLNRSETREYIQSQVKWAGGTGEEIFPEAACQSVHQATGGVPRLINQVCDHALVLAYVAGRRTIEPADVEEAWADLQQLPAPCNAERNNEEPERGVIEFGPLEDAADKAAATPKAPVFRVASVEDETAEVEDGAEPVGQIHRIERLLAKADEDFQPAGSIRPEIELYCEEHTHPFQEEFEQEEVVSDRYAAARAKQPVVEATKHPADTVAVGFPAFSPPDAAAGRFAIMEPPGAAQSAVEAAILPATAVAEDISAIPTPPVAAGGRFPNLNYATGNKRQEYRQLFSRLRRG